jgi:type IV pilus assembly protein PilE
LARGGGFTLIEILVVVSIVAILAAIAFPSYLEQARKSRRADAMSTLMRLQLAQERWRANDTDYATLAELSFGADSDDGFYTLALPARTAAGFTATAAPKAGTAQAGDRCGTFAMSQDGPDYSGSYAKANCWQR